jgi:hypothetical protein
LNVECLAGIGGASKLDIRLTSLCCFPSLNFKRSSTARALDPSRPDPRIPTPARFLGFGRSSRLDERLCRTGRLIGKFLGGGVGPLIVGIEGIEDKVEVEEVVLPAMRGLPIRSAWVREVGIFVGSKRMSRPAANGCGGILWCRLDGYE